MNKGIEILLARMDSNPDEFVNNSVVSRWHKYMDQFDDYMTDEDRKALFDKYNALQMDVFTKLVMQELLKEQGDRKAEIDMYAQQVRAKMQNRAAQQNAAAQQQYYYNNAQNQVGGITGLMGALGSATTPYTIQDSNQVTSELRVGKQSLTEKTIKKLKALVK